MNLCRWRWLASAAQGGLLLGVLGGLNGVNLASALTNFLAYVFSLIVALLLGGDPTALADSLNSSGGGIF
ncbi:MAG: hypothetical protein AB7Q17_05500 [Phycisphaerae bacterium]